MKSSESVKDLAEALCKAQSEMGGAVKDSSNPFFKSSYADLTSVIKAIKEPFSKNHLSYTQFPINNELGVGVVTRIMHKSGQWMEQEYVLPLVKRDPQAAGSAITYARRYALQSIAGIPTADDDAEAAMLRGEKSEEEKYKELCDDLRDSIDAIKDGIATGDYCTANEAWRELTDDEKTALWKAPSKGGCFTTQERATMKTSEFREAI
tara:strand:+ start:562 stop:1185 length:624 start_codon:yes stop_codon:yes gene_type:complete